MCKVHSFGKCSLRAYCVPGIVLGSGDTSVNKVGIFTAFRELIVKWEDS